MCHTSEYVFCLKSVLAVKWFIQIYMYWPSQEVWYLLNLLLFWMVDLIWHMFRYYSIWIYSLISLVWLLPLLNFHFNSKLYLTHHLLYTIYMKVSCAYFWKKKNLLICVIFHTHFSMCVQMELALVRDRCNPYWLTMCSSFLHSMACKSDELGVLPLWIMIWVLLAEFHLDTYCWVVDP